jgi:3'-phosphoadenosine 5'-phosphosulfate (PAPS) 3'-phosphatase
MLLVCSHRDDVAVATYAVQLASVVARELQKGLATRTAMAKSDSSPVTVADFSVQVIAMAYIRINCQ